MENVTSLSFMENVTSLSFRASAGPAAKAKPHNISIWSYRTYRPFKFKHCIWYRPCRWTIVLGIGFARIGVDKNIAIVAQVPGSKNESCPCLYLKLSFSVSATYTCWRVYIWRLSKSINRY